MKDDQKKQLKCVHNILMDPLDCAVKRKTRRVPVSKLDFTHDQCVRIKAILEETPSTKLREVLALVRRIGLVNARMNNLETKQTK